jgi:hypothetical protein
MCYVMRGCAVRVVAANRTAWDGRRRGRGWLSVFVYAANWSLIG